jgi:hypothetical protein
MLYLQKQALTSLTSGGRSVGVVPSQIQATEFFVLIYLQMLGSSLILAFLIWFPVL